MPKAPASAPRRPSVRQIAPRLMPWSFGWRAMAGTAQPSPPCANAYPVAAGHERVNDRPPVHAAGIATIGKVARYVESRAPQAPQPSGAVRPDAVYQHFSVGPPQIEQRGAPPFTPAGFSYLEERTSRRFIVPKLVVSMASKEREIYHSANGDRWFLCREGVACLSSIAPTNRPEASSHPLSSVTF
jgi:hypothetical protein